MSQSKLILVPTPIGNLDDITLRAIKVLQQCDLVLAEDTRVSRFLLKHLGIEKKLQSFHSNNEHHVLERTVNLIRENNMVALVSDAGTPAISDPGFLLVRACIAANIDIETLPGPTAFVPALVNSGFPCDRFCFEGFLPHKKGRVTRITEWLTEERTIILYESPHRLVKTLQQMNDILGPDREVCVCRELTKMYEEVKRGKISDLLLHYTNTPPKGEIVMLLRGCS